MTEYLYDKENPRSRLKSKPQGWESFYPGAPNTYERAEMITRRLLKDYDGDLSKFSLNLKKPRDFGQRWRWFKTLTVFSKNPIGYTSWRWLYGENLGRPFLKIWNLAVMLHIAGYAVLIRNQAKSKPIKLTKLTNLLPLLITFKSPSSFSFLINNHMHTFTQPLLSKLTSHY
jgi:hypothetical protein